MNRSYSFFCGMSLGASLAYLLDPNQGRRRRALLRDKFISLSSRFDDVMEKTWTDARQRAQGMALETSGLFSAEPVSDVVLTERIRSKMGRYTSHPSAVEVSAHDGHVTLSGPILVHEVDDLLACVQAVPGVRDVENRLEVHLTADDIPALQGGETRPGERPNLLETNWAPATRALAGAVGGGMLAASLGMRFPTACMLGTAGVAFMARAFTNTELKPLLGIGGGRRLVDIHKTITINAPIDKVFQFWTEYENFPRFMAHLREVRDLGGGRSHWVAVGPAGLRVSWNAMLTRVVPHDTIAWRSEPGSAIANAGIIRFERVNGDKTRVSIRFSYNPPAGALGHFAAHLFGSDAKSAMNEDLLRLKTLLEESKTSAPDKKVTRQEAMPETPTPVGVSDASWMGGLE